MTPSELYRSNFYFICISYQLKMKAQKQEETTMKKNTIISVLLVTSTILSLMGCSAPSSDASEAESELQLSESAPEETGESGETEDWDP